MGRRAEPVRVRGAVVRLSVGSSSERRSDSPAEGVPVALAQHQGFMVFVTTGDYHEMGTIEVDVTLEPMIGVPSDLAVAADGSDEPIMRSSVRLGVVESVC
jgi:hypothetical protein